MNGIDIETEAYKYTSTDQKEAIVSIAISLKRIADALEVALGILLEHDTDDDDAASHMFNQS